MMTSIQQPSPFLNPDRFKTTTPATTQIHAGSNVSAALPAATAWVSPPDITPAPNDATPISAWQQIAEATQTANGLPAGGWKFVNTASAEETTKAASNTARRNLIHLYQASRSTTNTNNDDGKLVVGGQGNFESIAKSGTGGLFLSTEEGDTGEG
jgi:hypothetical protein